jgi:hypothetical protein
MKKKAIVSMIASGTSVEKRNARGRIARLIKIVVITPPFNLKAKAA